MYTIETPKPEDLLKNKTTKLITLTGGMSTDKLLEYGFTNYNEPTLYFCRMLDGNISFNLSVTKDSMSIERIETLDENFLQPFDYQSILSKDNTHKFARKIFDKVDKVLTKLQQDGIIQGYKRGMYV